MEYIEPGLTEPKILVVDDASDFAYLLSLLGAGQKR
jgi:CheY-like chemotaxis protein